MTTEQRARLRLTGPQKQFFDGTKKFTLMSGGYGSGKSIGLKYRAAKRVFQNQGLDGMLVADTYGRLSRDIVPKIWDMLEELEIPWRWKKASVPGMSSRAMHIGPDWLDVTLHVGSADNPDSLKGPTLAFILVEEMPLIPRLIPGKSETTWGVLTSRLRQPGGTLTLDGSGTPEGRGNWTCDEGLWWRAPSDVEKIDAWRRDYQLIVASSWTNSFNPDGYVQSMVDGFDPQQAKEKIDGVPAAGVGGMAYYEFRVENNVGRLRYSRDYGPVLVGLDFNVNPMTCSFLQHFRGVLGVFHEIRQPHSHTRAMGKAIVAYLKKIGVTPAEAVVYPDASGRARKTVGGTDFAILRELGLTNLRYNRAGNPLVKDRLNAMNGALYHGRLLVDVGCKHCIRDLSLTQINDDGEILDGDGSLSHFSDGIGYVVVKLMPVRGRSELGVVMG